MTNRRSQAPSSGSPLAGKQGVFTYRYHYEFACRIEKRRTRPAWVGLTFRLMIPELGLREDYSLSPSQVDPLPEGIASTVHEVERAISQAIAPHLPGPPVVCVPTHSYVGHYHNLICVPGFTAEFREVIALVKTLKARVKEICSGSSIALFDTEIEIETVNKRWPKKR